MRDFVEVSTPYASTRRVETHRVREKTAPRAFKRIRRTLFLDSNSAWYFCFNTDVDALALSVFSFAVVVVVVVACSPIVLRRLSRVCVLVLVQAQVTTERGDWTTTDGRIRVSHARSVTPRRAPNVIHLDDDDDSD
jgi:hypothetical protein